MLQAQFITIVLAAHSATLDTDSALADAARAQATFGAFAARHQLALHGFHPFALGRVSGHLQAKAEGLSHCAPIPNSEDLFCARLSARLIDQSPVHLRVQALPGFTVLYAHWVGHDGRVRQLKPDTAGIFDLPSKDDSVALGVTVRGPLGPETGLYLRFEPNDSLRDPCGSEANLDDLLGAINTLRIEQGNSPLRFAMAPKAYAHARGQELDRQFGHSPLGLGRLLRNQGLRLRHAAEVVAQDSSLSAICRGWMLSPSHRAALLDARRDQIAFVQRGDRISALLWRRKL